MGFLAPVLGIATKYIVAQTVIGVGGYLYQRRQQKKMEAAARSAAAQQERGMKLSFGDPAQPRKIIYAREIRTSGPVIFAYTSAQWLAMAVPVTTQDIYWNIWGNAIRLYINGEAVDMPLATMNSWASPAAGTKYYGYVYVNWHKNYNAWCPALGSGKSGADTIVSGLAEKWDNTHTCKGFSYVSLLLFWHPDVFASMPDISIRVRPKQGAFTLGLWPYGNLGNPAIALYDYLVDQLGIPSSEIDTASFTAAATYCAQLVDGKPRFEIIAEFFLDSKPMEIVNTILQAMAADLVKVGTVFRLVFMYSTPTITLTDDDVIGALSVSVRRSRADIFNRVTGLFRSENQDQQPQNYPPVKDDTAIANDGEIITLALDLQQVPLPEQAQRVALIELKKNRLEIEVEASFKAKAINVIAGDFIYLTIDKYGWEDKPFFVQSHALVFDAQGIKVNMRLVETSPAIWDDFAGTSIGTVSQTVLPNANDVPPVTSLSAEEELYLFADVVGNRVILEWEHEYAFINKFEVQYRRSNSLVWTSIGASDGKLRQIDLDVEEATEYDFRVQAVNTLNYRSAWTYLYNFEVVGKTAPPADVGTITSSRSNQGITLTWSKVADLDVKQYLVRHGTTSQSWEDVASTEVRTGTSIFLPFFAAGTRRYFVKAIDTTGNESVNASTIDLVIDSPAAPTNFTIAIVDGQLEFNWTASAVSGNRVPIDFYRIVRTNEGPPFPLVIDSKTTLARTPLFAAGSIGFWIYAFDIAGNSGSVASDSFTINAPSNVTGFSASKTDGGVLLAWDLNTTTSNQLPISEYEIRYGASFAAGTPVGKTKGNVIVANFYTAATRTFWIRAIDNYGNTGTAVSTTFEIQNPGTPTAITTAKTDGGVVIKWTAPSVGANQLQIVDYEIRYGVDWATGTLVGIAKTTTITHSFFSASERFYFIKARDIVGNETTTAGVQSFTIQNPATVTGETITINEEDALLSFNEVAPGANQLPISEYEIRVGNTFESSTLVARQKGTQIKIPFFFVETPPSGTKTYWIRAFDIAGNSGTPTSVPFVINNPSSPAGLVVQVIRNVVFLNWAEPASTVPIRYYRISRSESPSDIVYGDFDSTAYRIEEPVGGTFTYKVHAIDFVGNMSDVSSQTIVVDDPDGFELVTTFSDPSYNTVGAITGDDYHDDDGYAVILGANITETIAENFIDGGWTTPQNKIDAGYPFYIQPVDSGNWTYTGEFDIGAAVSVGTIVLTAARQILNGLDYTQFEPEISVKENSGDPWIEFSNVWNVSTVNFRYIRIRIYFEITSPQQVINLAGEGITVRIQVAKKTEAGIVNALASDGAGTSYTLTRTFVDISEVTATVNGSSPYFATVTWTDPNPTEIKVFVFDTSNNRVNATVSLQIRGV